MVWIIEIMSTLQHVISVIQAIVIHRGILWTTPTVQKQSKELHKAAVTVLGQSISQYLALQEQGAELRWNMVHMLLADVKDKQLLIAVRKVLAVVDATE